MTKAGIVRKIRPLLNSHVNFGRKMRREFHYTYRVMCLIGPKQSFYASETNY